MAIVDVQASRGPEQARLANGEVGRGVVSGLVNPRPYLEELPALLQEDEFCGRLTRGFDDVIAPIYSTLDCWDSYLEADLAPDDFIDWLASWVGVEIDEHWPLERRRRLIKEIVVLYRIRGTSAGLASHVNLYAGVTPEILENGGCLWSQEANTPLPGSPDAQLTVRLQVPDPDTVKRATIERIVAASRPAHLAFTVEVQTDTGRVIAPEAPPEAGDGDGQRAAEAPGAVDLPGSEHIDLAPPGPEVQDGEQGPETQPPAGQEPLE
jgi:phage tail-like protein